VGFWSGADLREWIGEEIEGSHEVGLWIWFLTGFTWKDVKREFYQELN
jgi:hypothetical protein